jgi:iron complex outermembrane receptor protein
MLRKIICFLLSLFAMSDCIAQKTIVKGTVRSAAGHESLPGVSIFVNDTAKLVTDINGNFSLELESGIQSLRFQYISFETFGMELNLKAGEVQVLDVYLRASMKELDLVVISASKFEQKLEEVTVSMEVLKPGLVEDRNTTTMDEALQHVAGVSIIDGQANIRGGSGWSYGAGSRVQVLVDDLPQLTADASDAKWSFIPVENLEQIEVVKGASSVLFGSSALNGTINIRTAYPKDKPLTKINAFTGIYGKADYTLNDTSYRADWWGSIPPIYSGMSFFHSRKADRLDIGAGGNIFIDEGYRKGEFEQRARFNTNLKYRFKNIDGLSAGVNANIMTGEGSVFFLWKNDTGSAFLPAPNTLSAYSNTRTNVDPFITYAGKNGGSHKLRSRWFNTTNQNNTNQDSKADLYYLEYQTQQKPFKFITLTGGLVLQRSDVKSELYGDHKGIQNAAYIQADLHYGRLNFSLGSRVEQNKVDSIKEKWTPVFRSGINFRFLKSTYLRASYGQGYRYPSIAEKFIRTSVGNLIIYPNPQLEAEKGYSAEAGLRQLIRLGDWSAYTDLAVFENRYENMMEFGFAQWGTSADPVNGLGFRSMNVGDTRIRGIDLSLMIQGKLLKELGTVISAGYSYIDPQQLSFDSLYITKVGTANFMGSDSSDFLKYRYKHTLKADIEFEFRKIALGMSMRYHSRMVNIDKIFVSGILDLAFGQSLGIAHYREHRTKGDAVFDLRTKYRINSSLNLSFVVKNLFNHIYMERPADMQAPRTYVIQAGLSF